MAATTGDGRFDALSRGYTPGMTTDSTQPATTAAEAAIDQEAAEIDPRSPDAPDQIAELIDEADELGLPTPEPAEVTLPELEAD